MAPAEDVRRCCHEAEHTLVSLGRRGGGAASGGRPLGGADVSRRSRRCAGVFWLLSTRDLDPARRERDREDHDERGAMIRAMARARAGDVLLWLLLFGAAYLYFFDVPKWVSLILLTLACVKLLLDWMFTVWYRRQY